MASDRTPEGLSWLRSSILTGHPRCDAIRFIRTGQCLEGSDRGSEKARTKSPAAKGRKPHSSIAMLRSSPDRDSCQSEYVSLGPPTRGKVPVRALHLQLSQARRSALALAPPRGRLEPVEPLAVRCLAPDSGAHRYRPAGSRRSGGRQGTCPRVEHGPSWLNAPGS